MTFEIELKLVIVFQNPKTSCCETKVQVVCQQTIPVLLKITKFTWKTITLIWKMWISLHLMQIIESMEIIE
ncbi:hypothetical protein DAPPUDRAFT_310257 [Daphnia pulex]|uniref:Uncharacterized protein n=1 Tax=Daphnia pulex TaxID=6669 RepID=E9FT01_DAPPU|nr:hypothetical protein DAPPUDRAFT_310257 [Daphnia pulex]|eukprot:EFX89283.1 hypothetical protein DAPPUDRAFT_310257 [Daphnia pulex]